MAKSKASSESKKIVFGVRRKGKHQQTFGPKANKTHKNVGQGR